MKVNYCQDKGKCLNCGKTNHTSIWKVFEQVNWFRGDDEYLGKFCKHCRNAKAYETNNLHTQKRDNPITEEWDREAGDNGYCLPSDMGDQ